MKWGAAGDQSILFNQYYDDGTVGEISVVEEVEGIPSLTKSAIEAMGQWKFEPATKDGEPVDLTVRVPFQFKLDEKDRLKDKDQTEDAEDTEEAEAKDKPKDKDHPEQ